MSDTTTTRYCVSCSEAVQVDAHGDNATGDQVRCPECAAVHVDYDGPSHEPNEERADRGGQIVETFTDQQCDTGETFEEALAGLRGDISDAMADLLHLGERYGLDAGDLTDKAVNAWQADSEDGDRVRPRDVLCGRRRVPVIERYSIEATSRPSQAHWQGMGEPGEALADILDDMAAQSRCYRGEATDADFDRLEIGENRQDFLDGPTMQSDAAFDVVNGWALEISTARWVGHDGTPGDVARVEVVLGTGGPHVEFEISCTNGGAPERVELRRYWSQADRAQTTDPRALDIAAEWLAAFVVVE